MPFVPDDVFRDALKILELVGSMGEVAKQFQERNPTPAGLTMVALVFDRNGNLVGNEASGVKAHVPPGVVHTYEPERGVLTWCASSDHHLSTKEVATLAGVQLATVRRAVARGDLPKPSEFSPRKIAHRLDDVMRWIDGRKANAQDGSGRVLRVKETVAALEDRTRRLR